MATRSQLAASYGEYLVRDDPSRLPPYPRSAGRDGEPVDHASSFGEARPVLRVAAALAAIALTGFAVVVVALLALLGAT